MTPYRQSRLLNLVLFAAILLSLLAMVLMAAGCKTQVQGGSSIDKAKTSTLTGGQSQGDIGIAQIDLKPDGGVTIAYHRDKFASTQPSRKDEDSMSASTQPSVSTYGSSTPNIRTDAEGEWQLRFDRIRTPPKSQWPLFAMFLASAIACWKWGGNIAGALACLGLAIISVAKPELLVWLALAAILLSLWSVRKTVVQLVKGNKRTIKESSPELGEQLTQKWATRHDESTQRVVKSMVS